MNIEYLREFIEIGLSLNLSKAAKTLHISQPSLSKHIAALEQECQTPLLNRSSSRIQLTAAGEALFEEAHDLVRRHDRALERIMSFKHVNMLRIGGLFDSGKMINLINRALADVNATTNSISVSYQNYRHKPLSELLDDSKIDIAITILGSESEIGESRQGLVLARDPMVCLVGTTHPFATCEKIHVQDLNNQVILQPVGSHSAEHGRSTVRGIFARYHISPVERPVFVHSITELTTVPNEGCVFIMERSMLDTQPCSNNLVVVPFYEEDASFLFYALWSKHHQNPDIDVFVDALARVVRQNGAPLEA